MKLTFFGTPSHGYLVVPKKLIKKIGYPIENISSCSGHDLKNVYLEEDQDAVNFLVFLRENHIEHTIVEGHRERFFITSNFVPGYFDSELKPGEWVALPDGTPAKVVYWRRSKIVVEDVNKNLWGLPKSNPFRYLCNAKKTGSCM
jgi:hypothetical protein